MDHEHGRHSRPYVVGRPMELVHMHGTGNVFLVLDAFRQPLPREGELPALARAVCDRATGVGADGLLVVGPADGVAGRMRVYNADGSVAEMCGNGLRCVAKLLADRGGAGREFVVATDAGPRAVAVLSAGGERGDVRISLGRPVFDPARIPTTLPGNPPVEVPLELGVRSSECGARNGDSPHPAFPAPHSLRVTCVSM
ncbi:MAG TPA: diaminopimelate epimerase, partial [Planctomycetaceae bacterium]